VRQPLCRSDHIAIAYFRAISWRASDRSRMCGSAQHRCNTSAPKAPHEIS